jgi:hypothetical protein
MDFIYFLAFWGIFLTICGILALVIPDHHVSHEEF